MGVNVETRFKITDLATKALKGMATAASGVSSAFNKASNIVGAFGSIAAIAGGAFGAKEVITGTLEYLGTVKKIASVTGMAAENADGLLSAMKKSGLAAEDSSQILLQMSRRGAMLQMQMEASTNGVKGMGLTFRSLGIDLNKGPEAAFMRMSQLAKDHRIDASHLAALYRMPMDTATKLMVALKKGPEAIKKSMEELKKSGLAVTQSDLNSYTRIRASQGHIKEMWERIKIVLGKGLLPVLEKLMSTAESKLSGWVQHAQKFGDVMGRVLRDHLGLVMKISKVMLLNATLMRFTGGKGLFNLAGSGAGMIGRFAMGGSLGKDVIGMGGATGGIPGMLMKMIGGGGRMLSVFTRVSLIGVAIGAAFLLAKGVAVMFQKNIGHVRDKIMDLVNRVRVHFGVIQKLFEPVTALFHQNGKIGKFFVWLIPKMIDGLASAVDGIFRVIETIMIVVGKVATDWKAALLHPLKTFGDAWDEASRMIAKETYNQNVAAANRAAADKVTDRSAPDERVKAVYDFRGSRFDIVQKFAEGFDPDRIAVGFANDLATLGERKVQSSLSPLFGIR